MEKEYIQMLYWSYCDMYRDQCEAAEDEYLEWFEGDYAPPDKPWETKEEAASAFRSLYGEIFEDRYDDQELAIECGITKELDEYFNLGVF